MAGSPIAGPEIRLRTKDGLIVRTQGGGKSVDGSWTFWWQAASPVAIADAKSDCMTRN
jgi:hypothetical protein